MTRELNGGRICYRKFLITHSEWDYQDRWAIGFSFYRWPSTAFPEYFKPLWPGNDLQSPSKSVVDWTPKLGWLHPVDSANVPSSHANIAATAPTPATAITARTNAHPTSPHRPVVIPAFAGPSSSRLAAHRCFYAERRVIVKPLVQKLDSMDSYQKE